MKKPTPPIAALLQTLGVVLYCALIGCFLWFAGQHFEQAPNLLGITLWLFLLVFSAAVTGSLVFAYPTFLALNKKIKEAVKVLTYTFIFSLGTIILLLGVLFILQSSA